MAQPTWLNKAFLEEALGEEVIKHTVNKISGANDNFTSCLYRVMAELETENVQHLIIKKLLDDQEEGMQESSIFDREIHMYKVVLPKLEALLKEAIPGVQSLAPRYFFSDKGVLVLEDLSSAGFQMMDKRVGLDLDNSLLVMRTLARFHAASIILYEQDPKCFELFMHSLFSEPAMKKNLGPFFKSMVQLLANEIANWPEFGEKYSNKFNEMAEWPIQKIAEAAGRQEGRFNVLTHDDLWINNMLFRPPDDIRLIDFQLCHYASIGNDLQLFLTSSLKKEVFPNHIDTLLQEYHRTLTQTLHALESKKMITLEEVHEEYKKSSLYGFLLGVAFMPLMSTGSEIEVTMFDSDGVTPDRRMFDNPAVIDSMKAMIRFYEKLGTIVVT